MVNIGAPTVLLECAKPNATAQFADLIVRGSVDDKNGIV
jgi:hypothetical protein